MGNTQTERIRKHDVKFWKVCKFNINLHKVLESGVKFWHFSLSFVSENINSCCWENTSSRAMPSRSQAEQANNELRFSSSTSGSSFSIIGYVHSAMRVWYGIIFEDLNPSWCKIVIKNK